MILTQEGRLIITQYAAGIVPIDEWLIFADFLHRSYIDENGNITDFSLLNETADCSGGCDFSIYPPTYSDSCPCYLEGDLEQCYPYHKKYLLAKQVADTTEAYRIALLSAHSAKTITSDEHPACVRYYAVIPWENSVDYALVGYGLAARSGSDYYIISYRAISPEPFAGDRLNLPLVEVTFS